MHSRYVSYLARVKQLKLESGLFTARLVAAGEKPSVVQLTCLDRVYLLIAEKV
jgi:hypothetical protein